MAVIVSFIALAVFMVIFHWCCLLYIDDLKERINCLECYTRLQTKDIDRLRERIAELEKED